MSVEQLKDGRWVCRYPKGKNPEKSNGTKSYFGRGAQGEQKAWELNESLGLGKRKTTSAPTLTELANEYTTAKEFSMTPGSFEDVCQRLEAVILPYLGNYMAHNITHRVLDEYVKKRRTKYVKRGGKEIKVTLKMKTIRNDIATIRAIMNFAVKRRLIVSSPMQGYDLPKDDSAVIMPPSRQEIDDIVSCAVPHIKRAILISYFVGLRPGKVELLGLKWEHVDFINRTIMVTSAEKGGLPLRMVPLNSTIHELLKEWKKEDESNPKITTPYIVHYNGKRIDSIKKAWGAAKRRAGVTRRLRLYDIRHAFITTLLEKKADLKSVSEMAGHASPEITMRIYQHVSSNLKRDAVDLLE